ncbi:MAG: hypothetical protein ABSF70_12240 [Terracidiphilus sp.]|jgi:hypothetical protein
MAAQCRYECRAFEAPFADEPIGVEEICPVAAFQAWLKNNEPIPKEGRLAEFGLTSEGVERKIYTPLELHAPGQ